VQPVAAGGLEACGLRGGVVAENGGGLHLAAQKPDALAVLQVDGWVQDHGGPRRWSGRLWHGAGRMKRSGSRPDVTLDCAWRWRNAIGIIREEDTHEEASRIAASLAVFGSAALADPVEGVWQTKKDDNGNFGHIEIKPCGPAFCGTLITAFNGEGLEIENPNLGRQVVWDMVAYPDGLYDDGRSIRLTVTRLTRAKCPWRATA
jgi:hypothetical protein